MYIRQLLVAVLLVFNQIDGFTTTKRVQLDNVPAGIEAEHLTRDAKLVNVPLQGISIVSAGSLHTCGLTVTGGVKCWGDNYYGQLGDGTNAGHVKPIDVNNLLSGATTLSAGAYHTCVVVTSGGVKCWGDNYYGQLGDGTDSQHATPIDVNGLTSGVATLAAGAGHTCALMATGGIKCWGDNSFGQLGDGTYDQHMTPVDVRDLASDVMALTAGSWHTCALMRNGGVKCWGSNSLGQLGDGTNEQRVTPVNVTGLASGIVALAAGASHTCAVTAGGVVKCWGDNSLGALGDGTTVNQLTPIDVHGLSSGITSLATGKSHTCVVTVSGQSKCWGDNSYGQLGDGTSTQRLVPVDVSGLGNNLRMLVAGEGHTCGVMVNGGVKCWGSNYYGQLGDGTVYYRTIPMDLADSIDDGVTALTAGSDHVCALTMSGGAKCWGSNYYGQLGDGTGVQHSTPVDVSGLTNSVASLAAGYWHTCAVTANGGVKCWGANYYGQLGDGTTAQRLMPTDVTGLADNIVQVAPGGAHTCALTVSGGVQCWGYNHRGQLGNETTTDSSIPVSVTSLISGVTYLASGGDHTCAVTANGGVKCWGANYSGQLGDGTNSPRNTPVDVIGLTGGVVQLEAGAHHTCALLANGGAKCWGFNAHGQLGDGTTNDRSTPVDVDGLTSGVTTLAAGVWHTCALMTSGKVMCWGPNTAGELGDGTLSMHSLPVSVSGLASGGTSVVAGEYYTCAIINGQRPKCWGADGDGQLGLGTVSQRLTPVDVVVVSLMLNYADGQPGSFFTLTGQNFPADSHIAITVNGTVLTTTLTVNPTAGFIVFLDTTNANMGLYYVTIGADANIGLTFSLDAQALLRLQEGGGQVLTLPAGIALDDFVYLPQVQR